MTHYHAPTVRAVASLILENRMQLNLSLRECSQIGALIHEKTGVTAGLSYATVAKKEGACKELATSLVGSIPQCAAFLLAKYPAENSTTPPTIVVTLDGYTPGNAFRSRNTRQRLAIGLSCGVIATRFLTVSDKKKAVFHNWLVCCGLPQISEMQNEVFISKNHRIPLRRFVIGGDHAELWGLFRGCGGGGHRSAFCTTDVSTHISNLHGCERLSLQEMHAAGYTCSIAGRFIEAAYTLTPPLHDIKGMINMITLTVRGGLHAIEDVLGSTGGNMTGGQAREVLALLMRRTHGQELIVCRAMQVLVYYRFQNIPVHYQADATGVYAKDVLWAVLSYHIMLFLLEWAKKGTTCNAYAHSAGHWFDAVDAHRFDLSDEYFEQMNGERKRWAASTSPQTMERDFESFELQVKHMNDNKKRPPPPLPPVRREQVPQLYCYDTIFLCRCVVQTTEVWRDAARRLATRLQNLGLGAHVCKKTSWGQKFRSNPEKEGVPLKICVCDQEPWIPTDDTSEDSDSDSDDSNPEGNQSAERYTCVICTTTFKKIHGLYAHYDGVHREAISCECREQCRWCGKTVQKKGMSQHVLYTHVEKLDNRTCPLCLERFPGVHQRDAHMQSTHDV
eukprot:TRINITY_DN7911_c0_g1_i3.p1 TRINITY_DN7911_c0_g1~~TRINITY_DN7911_c0_g1_i3.p1  ORF type:complete len:618 (-),score=6.79 TRINITY_DN7911_c0_g1_i3:397-2250(-)